MTKITTVADLQKQTSPLTKYAENNTVLITNNGKGRAMLLPFFEGNQAALDRYYEDFEMAKNRETLKQRYQESAESQDSDLVI